MSVLRFTPIATPAIAIVWAEHARQQELQVVVLRAAGDRAAEDVGEQQQEDDRLQRHVDERLGRAHGLDQAAPGDARRCGASVAHAATSSMIAARWVSLAREGEEDLVEAGQVQRQLGDRDAGAVEAGDDGGERLVAAGGGA